MERRGSWNASNEKWEHFQNDLNLKTQKGVYGGRIVENVAEVAVYWCERSEKWKDHKVY